MNWIYGFFMAWGMFLAIPCPLKWWDEKARRHMLACLPLVGGIAGLVWGGLAWLCEPLPMAIRSFVLAAAPWICTGFMHLDGYMDVCDAVLSRRDLATRQRILKDSHCGAFAVICIGLLMLGQWSIFASAESVRAMWFILPFVCISVRACAGIAIMTMRPMGSSQYAAMAERKAGFVIWLGVILAISVGIPIIIWNSYAPLAAAAGYWVFAIYGFRQLDGINGDISGFALTLGECIGAAAWVLVR